uniref:Uncharacterized protein n=1 Tax=Mesocestoides corti TaxID=53468 RepID=A0A5K3FMD2_MESCO
MHKVGSACYNSSVQTALIFGILKMDNLQGCVITRCSNNNLNANYSGEKIKEN